MITYDKHVAVIGGGVSGIACAHYLTKLGLQVSLFEEGDRLGGRMALDTLGDKSICLGGKNIGYQYKEFRNFLDAYGEPEYEYFGINSSRVKNGKIVTFDSKNKLNSILNLLRSASLTDAYRLIFALMKVKNDRTQGDLGASYFAKINSKKLRNVAEYFSDGLCDEIFRSLTVRVSGAEPDEVSLENFGTHLQMILDQYEQLSDDVGNYFSKFSQNKNLNLYLNQTVLNIECDRGIYKVQTESNSLSFSDVVVALPARSASKLLFNIDERLSKVLDGVNYFPVGVIVAEYQNNVFSENVRAIVFDKSSPLSNVGCYGISDRNIARYTFSGKQARPLLYSNPSAKDLLNDAEKQIEPYLNIEGNRLIDLRYRKWDHGLCAYTLNQMDFLNKIKNHLSNHSGLYITGDYLKGVSIENCFRAARETAEAVYNG